MLDRAVSYRDDYDYDYDDARRARPGLIGRVLGAMARRPGRTAVIALLVVASAAITANAVFFQSGEHPSPLFSTRDTADDPQAVAALDPAPAPAADAPLNNVDEIGRLVETAAVGAPQIEGEPASVNVVRIQSLLSSLGYEPGTIDGLFGARTRTAIEEFQRDRDLPVTGEVSTDLLAALEAASEEGGERAATPIVADAEATILAVQTALNRSGYGPVATTGEFTPAMADAIRSFQMSYGLELTGEVDQALINRMVAIGALEPN